MVKITADEDEEIGKVKFEVYKSYVKYLGGFGFALTLFILMFCWQLNKGGSDLWLAYWSKPENQEENGDQYKKLKFLLIYSFY